ncbi:hypothetical protein C9374_003317 [Naegleria lovaniensis]|uniref:Exocyst complex component Sec6 n=1 Tax=Naegleria lovaniensis TaxID=51637 RepID=A0AA88GR45_NAELO|nr:uncharacterized protein C9374_003317 [Naegleria lovaniensis]KAG2385502.1 hypothetical protein C9374_003317 [Naegleria lovaniensis]
MNHIGEQPGFDYDATVARVKRFAVALAETELQSSKSLENVASEIQNIQNNNTLLHNQITTLCSAQIEEAQRALLLINSSQNILKDVKSEFSSLKEKARKGQEIIKCYSTIRKAFSILSMIGKTREWIARLLHLRKEVFQMKQILRTELEKLMNQDEEIELEEEGDVFDEEVDLSQFGFEETDFNDEEPHNVLITIYERLCGLEDFRLKALDETSNNPQSMQVFSKYLSIIDSVMHLFNKVMEKHFENAVGLSHEEPEKLIQVIRIMERDEKRKRTVEADSLTSHDMEPVTLRYSYKNYRQMCLESIERYVQNSLRYEVGNDENIEDVMDKMKNLVESELETIEKHLVVCFPTKYNIFEKCVEFFDNEVRHILSHYITDETDNITRSQILKWLIEYPEIYDPYLDYLEAVKIDYSGMITDLKTTINITFFKSIMEWREKLVQNLFNTICKDNSDEKGFLIQDDILYTYGPIDFFTTLDQALQSISQCGQKDLMEQISFAIRQTLTDYTANLKDGVNRHMDKITIKRLIALSNDCSKCILFTQDLQDQIAEVLPDLEMEKITMEEVLSGFSSLSSELVNTLCQRFISKIDPCLEKIFTKDWYSDKGEHTCVTEALELLQNDIQLPIDFMEWEKVVTIVTKVFNHLVTRYIDSLMTKKFTFTKEEREIVKNEIAASIAFLPPEDDNGWVSTIVKPLRLIEDVFDTIDDEDLLQCMSEATSTYSDLGEIVFETLVKKAGFTKDRTELYLSTISQFFKTKSKLAQRKHDKKSLFGVYNPKVEEDKSSTKSEVKEKKTTSEKRVKKKKSLRRIFSSQAEQPKALSASFTDPSIPDDDDDGDLPSKPTTTNSSPVSVIPAGAEKKKGESGVSEMNLLDYLDD